MAHLEVSGGLKLTRSAADHSLWSVMKDQAVIGLLGTYVDDFLLVGEPETLETVITALESVWKLKRRGVLQQGVECGMEFLGMELLRLSTGALVCHQRAYIDDSLLRWNMENANPAKLTGEPESYKNPVAWRERVEKDERPLHELDYARKRAQGLIGGLLWLSTRTRPDAAYSVGVAASLVHNSPDDSFAQAKHLLKYVKGTRDLVMRLTPLDNTLVMTTWTDASFAPEGGNSPTGILVEWRGIVVAWRASRTHLK